jgi:hypothetical protein
VNQNNPGALDLYRGLGFLEQCCRSTWHRFPDHKPRMVEIAPANSIFRRRRQMSGIYSKNGWSVSILIVLSGITRSGWGIFHRRCCGILSAGGKHSN